MFKELFTEAENEDFCSNLEKEYRKYFPNGHFACNRQKALSGEIYSIQFGMIKDLRDVSQKIRQNDPMWHQFLIFINSEDSLELSPSSQGISIEPQEGSYLAMGRVKTKMRKTKGDHAKLEKYLKGYFKKLHGLMKDNQENIYNKDNIPPRYFVK